MKTDSQVQHFQKASEGQSCVLNPEVGWEGQKSLSEWHSSWWLLQSLFSGGHTGHIPAASQNKTWMLTTPWHINFCFGKELGSEESSHSDIHFWEYTHHRVQVLWLLQQNYLVVQTWASSWFSPESSWCPIFEMLSSAGKTSLEPCQKDIQCWYLWPDLLITSVCWARCSLCVELWQLNLPL